MNKLIVHLILMATCFGLLLGCDKESAIISPSDVFCVASVNGDEFIAVDTVYIKVGDTLEIQPVFIYDGQYFSSISGFYLNDVQVFTSPLAKMRYEWQEISPVFKEGGYDNFENAPHNEIMTYVEPVTYHLENIKPSKKALSFADFSRAEVVGTYYIKAGLAGSLQTDFESSKRLGGKDGIIQIVCRNDDTYLGYLSELMGTPFIMFPKVLTDGFHQTDALIGSDCAEFAIYGKRRLGDNIPYCGPKKLSDYLDPVAEGRFFPQSRDGKQLLSDKDGYGLVIGNTGIKPGDILHYGSQVAVFFEDRGIIGVLDGEDIVMQSYGETVHFATLSDNAQMFGWFEVFRWK